MAKVLIQEGIKKYFENEAQQFISERNINTDQFRDSLEKQSVKRLKELPKGLSIIKN